MLEQLPPLPRRGGGGMPAAALITPLLACVQLRVAEQYIQKVGEFVNPTDTTTIAPAGVAGIVTTAMGVIQRRAGEGLDAAPAPRESPFRREQR